MNGPKNSPSSGANARPANALPAHDPGTNSPGELPTRFLLGIDDAEPPQGRRQLAVLLFVLCVTAATVPLVLWQRIILAVVGIAGLVRIALHIRARARSATLGEVVIEGEHIKRRNRRETTELAAFDAPFGLAVFADPRRTRAILAFTTPTTVRYLTARLGHRESIEADKSLRQRAAAVAESDALGAQLDLATLSAKDAESLIAVVAARQADAVGRIFVTGATGETVVLDRTALRVGSKVFDLAEPLEWKAFMFHETVGSMAMLYHATWVRQELSEVVLVSSMPPEVSALFSDGPDEVRAVVERSSEMPRAIARDLRIMQASADTPPPVETRVAVERMFMFPLRRALDSAPRARISLPSFRMPSTERNLPP